jgi:recombination protein RecA
LAAKASGPSTAALRRFEEMFAKTFGDAGKLIRRVTYEVISTGSIELDTAMGVGGYVRGRITEMWGPESTGKSTMLMIGLANAQRQYPDEVAGLIDMEQTYDANWAQAHGVDLDKLIIVQPNDAEDVADMLKKMIESGLFSMVGVDSVGGMVSRAEKEKDAEEATVGIIAKIVTRMVRIAAPEANKKNVAVIIINQVRGNISANGRGPAITRSGGFALGHSSTHRLKYSMTGETPITIGSGENAVYVGREIAIKVEKNKVAPPNKNAKVVLFNQETKKFGSIGIDRVSEAFSVGKRRALFEQSGSFYTLPDGTRHQGRDAAVAHLREHPELVDKIRTLLLEQVADTVVNDELEEGTT